MTEIEQEAMRLRQAWFDAAARADEDDAGNYEFDAEQAAWDACIEFVEANGLNYTKYDPRGLA